MKKVQIHQFDPIIYPLKLWIVKNPNIVELKSKFLVYTNDELNVDTRQAAYASTYNKVVLYKETNKYGILIMLNEKLNVNQIAHEATHAVRVIWDWLNEDFTGVEADAYLVGWIAECINQVNINKFKD